jgi:hypothetical protein
LERFTPQEVLYLFPNSDAVLLSESDVIAGKLCLSLQSIDTPVGFFDNPPRAFELRDGVLGVEKTEFADVKSVITSEDVKNAIGK